MLVSRSKLRPIASPPQHDPYAGEIHKSLGEANARRTRVTLAALRSLTDQRETGGRT